MSAVYIIQYVSATTDIQLVLLLIALTMRSTIKHWLVTSARQLCLKMDSVIGQ